VDDIAKWSEQDVEVLLQRAREKFPDAWPRIISDNGPRPPKRRCPTARDFKQFTGCAA
jgi:hypothetical protein